MNCRYCQARLDQVFLDLGSAPPSNAYLDASALQLPEAWFPLKLHVCGECRLVQVDEVQHHAALFSPDYAYFSSYSESWLAHARAYVATARERLGLAVDDLVIEVASNDGYLLQYVQEAGIRCLGIEPTRSTAQAARERGIETIECFLGRDTARAVATSHGRATLLVANNVLAHVPDLNDFVTGLATLLAPNGTLTLEFPHLARLVEYCQFDTVYHEHFSYFSLHTAMRVLSAHGLATFDVEELPTHGGSLRLWVRHAASKTAPSARVAALLAREQGEGVLTYEYYRGFQRRADALKDDLIEFLISQKRKGRRVVGYGAAAKGNTLLNYAGVRPDLLPWVVDASPHKQGKFLPGSRIPVVDPSEIHRHQPDVVLLLPWNLREEITTQLAYVRDWGGQFAVAIPRLEVF